MARQQRVYIIGCGGHAKVVLETLRQLHYHVAAIFDDDFKKHGMLLHGIPVAGSVERIVEHPRLPAVIAVGDNCVRQRIADQYDLDWLTLIHPFSFVASSATLGVGAVVFAGAVVQSDAVIGDQAIINTCASVDHDCQLGRFVHVAPGARLAGGVVVGDKTLIGIGAVVIPERRIGARSIVGAGAVVTRDLPADVTAVGIPARII